MKFSANKFYYLHNFGIDYQTIFFSQRNKTYFLEKISKYIKPYAKVIEVKLAENQFHILIKTNENYNGQDLNKNIGIMLRSYTRAINKQENRIGSLFCQGTKAFARISEIPSKLRDFIAPFISLINKGMSVNFGETVKLFIKALKDYTKINIEQKTFTKHNFSFKEVFNHPLSKLEAVKDT